MEKKKLSLSIFDLQRIAGWEKALEMTAKAGFDGVDFDVEHYPEIYKASEDEFVSFFTKIKEKADSLGLEIFQTHGRCETYKGNNAEYNEMLKNTVEKDIHASAILGSPACVIHPIALRNYGNISYEKYIDECINVYRDFVPFAEKHKVKLSLETVGHEPLFGKNICCPFAYPQSMQKIYDGIDTEYKTICLDSGHINEVSDYWVPSVQDVIRTIGKNVSITHLHDNRGTKDDHLLPPMGNINWPAVFDAFEEVGYQGAYNFELRLAFWGSMKEDAVNFIGKFLRKFIDERGRI